MKINTKLKKVISICLAVVFVAGCMGLCAVSASNNAEPEVEEETIAVAAPSESNELAGDGEITKDETVYVLCAGDGAAREVIVSDWLQNSAGDAAIEDVSHLENIKNVKGGETFTVGNNGSLTWNTDGSDICYRGDSDQSVPVQMTVQYWLDGKEIAPDALAGQSGEVTIRFSYTNTQSQQMDIDGTEETVYVPFMVMTGVYLDSDLFSNVTVENGKLLNDGSKLFVAGYALPGVKESIGVTTDTYNIPDYFQITADVTDFALQSTYSVAVNLDLNSLNIDAIDSVDDLKNSMTELSDASSALVEGANALSDGLGQLMTKSGELSGGLSQLSANSAGLNAGAQEVFKSLLATANSEMKLAGLDLPELTIGNYATVLGDVLGSMDADAIYNAACAKVSAAVRQQESTIREKVSAAVEQTVYEKVLAASGQTMTYEEYQQAKAAGYITNDIQTAVETAVSGQMESTEVQAQIDSLTESKIQELIDAQMNSKDVQNQISAATEAAAQGSGSLVALKAQLDSYNQFYQGLLQYTGGVDTAATGAQAMINGIAQLQDGANELAQGMKQFDEEGVRKLVDAFGGDIGGITGRLQAMADASEAYNNFSGISDGMDGAVKFIFKTDAI